MLVGAFALLVFKIIKKFNLKNFFYSFLVFFYNYLVYLLKNYQNFDQDSINNYNFKIPISVSMHIDNLYGALVYQNFMKTIFGYGPDTSNFIEDGQRVIGSELTGTMKFIPSHPIIFD